MDPQLSAQLRQVISYATSSATADAFGQTLVGSTATLFARVEPRVREVENDNGTFSRTSHMLVIDAVAGFTPTLATRLWLDDVSASTAALARQPKVVHPCFGERGSLEHWEILV